MSALGKIPYSFRTVEQRVGLVNSCSGAFACELSLLAISFLDATGAPIWAGAGDEPSNRPGPEHTTVLGPTAGWQSLRSPCEPPFDLLLRNHRLGCVSDSAMVQPMRDAECRLLFIALPCGFRGSVSDVWDTTALPAPALYFNADLATALRGPVEFWTFLRFAVMTLSETVFVIFMAFSPVATGRSK